MREGRGRPFGCVIARDGAVIGEGVNTMDQDHDPTAHGEVMAIRDACKRLGTIDLSGAVLYTSCEPCPMCASAIYLAGIAKVFYAAAAEDTGGGSGLLRTEIGKPIDARSMPSEQLMGDEGRALLAEWRSA
jgi:tRNA(Arg) A34 adenosine deaminase TadA